MPIEESSPNTANLHRGRTVTILIVAVLFAIGFMQVFTGNNGFVTAQVDDRLLGVSGNYGDPIFVELDTITDLQMVDSFEFGTCLEGDSTDSTISGRYSCQAYPEYTVHAYLKISPVIIVSHPDGVLVFNCSTSSLTEKTYNQLVEATGISG